MALADGSDANAAESQGWRATMSKNILPKVISPLSVVKVTSNHPGLKDVVGKVFRVGYYRKNDGLMCLTG